MKTVWAAISILLVVSGCGARKAAVTSGIETTGKTDQTVQADMITGKTVDVNKVITGNEDIEVIIREYDTARPESPLAKETTVKRKKTVAETNREKQIENSNTAVITQKKETKRVAEKSEIKPGLTAFQSFFYIAGLLAIIALIIIIVYKRIKKVLYVKD